jgi:Ser/Thr protein kinase RdoA (MazF antagonist)
MIEDLAKEAAAHWGGTAPRLIRNRENAVFEIRLPNGPAALRLHRMGYQSDAAIWSELWWCAALAAEGVAVPAALPDLRGDLLVTLSNGRKASVIEWVEGEALGIAGQPFDMPLPTLLERHHALGRLVAEFHAATARLTLPEAFTRPRWDIPGLVGEAPFWGRFWEHPEATADQRATLIRARAFLHAKLEAHNAKAPVVPVHADVLRENVLVHNGALSLIDFDDSGWGFALYDLGTVLSQNLYEPAYEAIRDALMSGYGTEDCEMVEIFTLARTCASVGWTRPRLAPGDPVHPRHLARACMWAERMFDRWG